MYGLRQDIDLEFLRGLEVQQAVIGVYQVQFGFNEDVRISVEGELSYFDGQHDWTWRPEPGATQVGARAVALLGATILSYEGHTNGTLVLGFSNGSRLTIWTRAKSLSPTTSPGQAIIV